MQKKNHFTLNLFLKGALEQKTVAWFNSNNFDLLKPKST